MGQEMLFKMDKHTIFSILLGLGVLTIIGLAICSVLSAIPTSDRIQLNYDKCCGGNPCTDTYYSEKDGLCHSTFEHTSFYPWNSPLKTLMVVVILGVALTILLYIKFLTAKANKMEQNQTKLKGKGL